MDLKQIAKSTTPSASKIIVGIMNGYLWILF